MVQATIGSDTFVGVKRSKYHLSTLVNCCCPYNAIVKWAATRQQSSRVKKLPVIANSRLLERTDTACHQTSEQQHTPYSDQHSVTMLLSNAEMSLSCRTTHPGGPVQKETTYLHRSSPNKLLHQTSPSVSPYRGKLYFCSSAKLVQVITPACRSFLSASASKLP